VLSSPHGRQFAGWTRPQPTLDELREQYGGRSVSDEELLLRYMVPAEDIDAVRAAGPLRTGYDFTDVQTLPRLVEHMQGLQRTRSGAV
jgi:oxaloacetate decarboxylase (Na+ extruding) subunit alpha